MAYPEDKLSTYVEDGVTYYYTLLGGFAGRGPAEECAACGEVFAKSAGGIVGGKFYGRACGCLEYARRSITKAASTRRVVVR